MQAVMGTRRNGPARQWPNQFSSLGRLRDQILLAVLYILQEKVGWSAIGTGIVSQPTKLEAMNVDNNLLITPRYVAETIKRPSRRHAHALSTY